MGQSETNGIAAKNSQFEPRRRGARLRSGHGVGGRALPTAQRRRARDAQGAEARGLSSALFGPNLSCIKSGALYVFDRHSLESLLRSSTAILVASGWPLDPDQFVARIAREWIDHAHSIAPVIKRAFGDEPT